MHQIVQSYLRKRYEIKTSEIGNDGVYELKDTRRFNPPYPRAKLLKELKTIFDVTENIAKDCVTKWAELEKTNVDLSFYWKRMCDFLPKNKYI
jgi:hypothetical protein